MVAVVFEDRGQSTECYKVIHSLRQELLGGREFKFCDCRHDYRERFFAEASRFAFKYCGVVVSKQRMAQKNLNFNRPFFIHPTVEAIDRAAANLEKATVVFDRTGSSKFRKELGRELKRTLNERHQREVISKVKDVVSHTHNLVQLADMVCGALTRSYDDSHKHHDKYRQMIRAKEISITDGP